MFVQYIRYLRVTGICNMVIHNTTASMSLFKNTVKPRLSSMSQTPKQWLSGMQGKKEIHRGKRHILG